jgi:CreA protein
MSEQATTETKPSVPFDYSDNITISVNVANLEKAIDWYRDVLGFEVEYKLAEYGWCEVSSPVTGVTLGLGQAEEPKVGGITPTFGVKDIDAARKHLESREVRFDGDTYEIDGMVKLATFYDPDGNSFMLAQNLTTEA